VPRRQLSARICGVRLFLIVPLLLLTAGLARSAQAQAYSVVHAFTNTPDGGNPNPIIRDAQGNLYGTTIWGGVACAGGGYTCGTVFRVDETGHETVLYRFAGGDDGANPVSALIQDTAGNLYGTTRGNGSIPAVSTLFKVNPQGRETVLYRFDGQSAAAQTRLWSWMRPGVFIAARHTVANSTAARWACVAGLSTKSRKRASLPYFIILPEKMALNPKGAWSVAPQETCMAAHILVATSIATRPTAAATRIRRAAESFSA
jgi:uncharacterized repeat protein (TIGR03803 family)